MADFFERDLTDQYNTQLSAKDEKKFQEWVYGNGRIRDLYDYDLRGAWKELQSGSMSADERGHLGDKYKKPNHPTFSDQSIYAKAEPSRAGTWSRSSRGVVTFTTNEGVSMSEAQYLKRYFQFAEPETILEIKKK